MQRERERKREHSLVFRQRSELCLIWLHDIPHISHQAQGPLFALALTLFPQMPWPWLLHGSVALSRALILRLNSHLPPLTHASCCIYLFLSLLLSPVLSCFILPYPANLMSLLSLPLSPAHSLPPPPLLLSPCLSLPRFPPSLPCSLPSAVEVRYDAEPKSSPVFNYINKTPCEVEWPRTPQPSPYPPHPSPSSRLSPSLLFSRLGSIEAPCRPSPIGARLHFMADCEACVSPSSALVPPPISSSSRHAHFTGGHVRDFSLPPWPAAGGRRRRESAGKTRPPSPNSGNEGHALPDELLGDANHPDHSPCRFRSHVALPDSVNGKAMRFPPRLTDSIWGGKRNIHLERSFSAYARFWFTWHWWMLSAPCVIKLKSEAHKMPRGPEDNGPVHINYGRSRMAYDKQQ